MLRLRRMEAAVCGVTNAGGADEGGVIVPPAVIAAGGERDEHGEAAIAVAVQVASSKLLYEAVAVWLSWFVLEVVSPLAL